MNNNASRIELAFASIIDFIIYALFFAMATLLVPFAKELFALYIIGCLVSITFFLCKDLLWGGSSIGKRLLGLKIESVKDNDDPGLNGLLVLRNVPECLYLLLFDFVLFSIFYGSHIYVWGIVLSVGFVLFHMALLFISPGRKVGDFLSGTRVVRKEDGEVWKGITLNERLFSVAALFFFFISAFRGYGQSLLAKYIYDLKLVFVCFYVASFALLAYFSCRYLKYKPLKWIVVIAGFIFHVTCCSWLFIYF